MIIGNLTSLTELDLSDNTQYGETLFGNLDRSRPIAGTGLSGVLNQFDTRNPFEKPIARAGAVPASMASLTNLEKLDFRYNGALEKPPGCDGDMYYDSKEEVAAFLRSL